MKIPHGKDGQYLYDTITKELEPNPHYVAIKQNEIVRGIKVGGQSINELFGLPEDRYYYTDINLEYLAGPTTWNIATQESKELVIKVFEDLERRIVNKEKLEYSLLISLGNQVKVNDLAFALLAKMYTAGYTVSAFKNIYEITKEMNGYKDVYTDDVAIIIVPVNMSYRETDTLNSLLQIRDSKGLPTIVISQKNINLNNNGIKSVLNTEEGPRLDTLFLAKLEYDKGIDVNKYLAENLDYDFTKIEEAKEIMEATRSKEDTDAYKKIMMEDFSDIMSERAKYEATSFFLRST